MKLYAQVENIRNIRDFTSWAQYVTVLRNQEDIPAYDDLSARVAALEAAPSATNSWGGIAGNLSSQSDLVAALDGKATVSHTHSISDITGLQSALDSKQPSGSYITASALNELVDDRVAALFLAGANISLTYDDASNTFTIAASGGGGNSYFPQGW